MHSAEVLVLRTDTDYLLGYLGRVRVLGVETSNKGIGLARLNHHHTEIVALEHLIVGLLIGVAVALTLLSEDSGIALTTLLLVGVTQVDNLDAVQREVKALGEFHDYLVVA